MLNISPIGRNCSRPERNDFEAFDKDAKVRETMVGILRKEFGEKYVARERLMRCGDERCGGERWGMRDGR